MSKILEESECGIKFGTEVEFARQTLGVGGGGEGKNIKDLVWINFTGEKCTPIKLKFDRAGHNHYDELYAYCFKFPSGEEVWIAVSDDLSIEQRVQTLRKVFNW